MPFDYYPEKQIHFTTLADGSLLKFGIDAELNGPTLKLVASDNSFAVVQEGAYGWAEFVGEVPLVIRHAIAREYETDIPFLPPRTHAVVKAPILEAASNLAFLAAGKECDRLRASSRNREFRKLISCLEVEFTIDFAGGANTFLRKAHRKYGVFSVDIKNSSWAEMFFLMTGMGFFRRFGIYYEMVTPSQLTVDMMMEAFILLLDTKDDDGLLHPERHLATMTHYSAKYHRKRIRKIKTSEPSPAEQEPTLALASEMSHG